ncbi:hypothetical protein Z950_1216 [Sulfitobacter mediterraneus KCTC 32188]|nr:hypothetical protein Z950_1216 [Sulfitobacter mediterraneus KCTC 32188]
MKQGAVACFGSCVRCWGGAHVLVFTKATARSVDSLRAVRVLVVGEGRSLRMTGAVILPV